MPSRNGYILLQEDAEFVNKRVIVIALTGLIALPGCAVEVEEELNVGTPAPPFSLTGSDGKEYSLADINDGKVVVLAWFPKAFTGG